MVSSRHEELRKVAREYLKSFYGFQEGELVNEYPVPRSDGRFVVDVAGISSKQRVAAEVGSVSIYKVLALSEYFDDVVWIPYWVNVVTGTEDFEALVKERVNAELNAIRHEAQRQEASSLELERRRHAETFRLLERVLWVVESRVSDPKTKADVARLLEGRGFESHRFSKAMLKPDLPLKREKSEDPGEQISQ